MSVTCIAHVHYVHVGLTLPTARKSTYRIQTKHAQNTFSNTKVAHCPRTHKFTHSL